MTVIYTGWLYDATKTDGKGTQFDASLVEAFVRSLDAAGVDADGELQKAN